MKEIKYIWIYIKGKVRWLLFKKRIIAEEDRRHEEILTSSLGPIGTEKRDEYEALISGRSPKKPLKYFSVSYRIGDYEVKVEPPSRKSIE